MEESCTYRDFYLRAGKPGSIAISGTDLYHNFFTTNTHSLTCINIC